MSFAPLLSLLFLAGLLLIASLFLLTLHNALKAVSPVNRKIEPGMIWLWLIPLFNLVWQFIVVKRLSASIEAEYRSRGLSCPLQPTYKIGLALSILNCLSILFIRIPVLGGLISTALLVCFIVYWVQVNGYKHKLRRLPPPEYNDSEIFGNLNR